MNIGILPLGRPTFDVPYAEEQLQLMLNILEQTGEDICGPRTLLFDEASTLAAIDELKKQSIDQLLILQVTFTDASMAVAAANAFEQPISIWAVPEPRSGGRLRLNAFCGLNLASHALSLNGRAFSSFYKSPYVADLDDLKSLFAGRELVQRKDATIVPESTPAGEAIAQKLHGRRIARIGEHPVGFDTCAYEPKKVEELAGVQVDALQLEDLFDRAKSASNENVDKLRAVLDSQVPDAESVDQSQLDRSLRLKLGLDQIRSEGGYDAFALRCWPEVFTEYGGAMCGPAGMQSEAKVPCACEADVYGALTQMVLQTASNQPVFLTDLVDMDAEDNSGVVWHCGQAPLSMCDETVQATATVHTNRKQPLLYQFPLKPGPVTLVRISQSYNQPKMILAFGEMLKRPMAFTGTSGVVRFARPADVVLADILASGLEHHMALTYGDHRNALRATAGAMGLPLLEI